MMLESQDALSLLIKTLEARSRLDEDDKAAILGLPCNQSRYERGSYLVRNEQAHSDVCSLMSSGIAYRHRVASTGMRQIIGMLLPGDIIDFEQLLLTQADQNIQAATPVQAMAINRFALKKVISERPRVREAIWRDALVRSSILSEWLLNVGRRSAKMRVAHLLCELITRMDLAGLSEDGRYNLPITQEQIGDATGLTSVHVNRMIRELAAAGAINYARPILIVNDRTKLWNIGGFNALYLHLGQP